MQGTTERGVGGKFVSANVRNFYFLFLAFFLPIKKLALSSFCLLVITFAPFFSE